MPILPTSYEYYLAGFTALVVIICFCFKASATRTLIISLLNLVYGLLVLTSLTPNTPGLSIMLIVSAVLTIFGIWGFVLWIKYISNQYKDQPQDDEAIEGWWSTVKAFDIILILGIALRLFVIQPFLVDGPSMEQNFQNNEMILVDKISYRLREPIRGEVVIFQAPKSPQDDYIKRMIGLPGDNVEIKDNKVYVNGKMLDQSFLSPGITTTTSVEDFKITVGQNEYFVLGDNRPHSSDSREWGTVPKQNMIGRAIVAIYPIDLFGPIKTPDVLPQG